MNNELSDLIEPLDAATSEADLCEQLRTAHDRQVPVYPVGGGLGLNFGRAPRAAGWGIPTSGLNQIVDYPAADMTITVGSGITIAELQDALREFNQQLPLDIPFADQATLGGVLATNCYGHRRFGYGTARDYVIGIRAVDGRGSTFSGGGRVVKNVAGYDFCKLLVGSVGILGVISQVTLKLKPIPPVRRATIVPIFSTEKAESILAGLVHSETQPIAVSWLAGPTWSEFVGEQSWSDGSAGHLFILFEGTPTEVDWSQQQLVSELTAHVASEQTSVVEAEALMNVERKLTEFGANRERALIVQASVLPGRVSHFIEQTVAANDRVSLLSHAGNGIVLLEFEDYPEEGVGVLINQQLRPWANQSGGNVCVIHNRDYLEATTRTSWGTPSGPIEIMKRIKTQFDPHGILNRDRFIV